MNAMTKNELKKLLDQGWQLKKYNDSRFSVINPENRVCQQVHLTSARSVIAELGLNYVREDGTLSPIEE